MAAATIIAGDQTTGNINQSQRKIDMDNVLHQLEPNVAPLTVLTQKLKKRTAISPKVEWLEHGRMPRFDTLSASAAGSDTTVSVNHGSYFRVGDIVRITETGEAIQVTVTAASGISATRGIGGVATASATSAAELFIVGNVNAEGASLREIKTRKLDNLYNYAEINRNPTGLTGTDAASTQYGGVSRSTLQADAGVEHMRDWENIALVGARSESTLGATPSTRSAGGFTEFVTTNVTNVGGALSEAAFQTFLQSGFRYGGDRKLLLCSPKVLGAIEGYARSNVRTSSSTDHADTYGIKMSTYMSGAGTVDLVQERWMADSVKYAGWAFLVDLDNVFFAELRGSKLLENRQANDADKMEDEWLGEGCFVYANELTHATLRGVTG